MAQRARLRPWRSAAVGCRINSVPCVSSPRGSKRCWVRWRAPGSGSQPSTPQGPQGVRARQPPRRRLAGLRAALCPSRERCVPRHLHTTARKPLWRGRRGWPQVRVLRAVMEQVSAWCARRCRTQTALDTLAQLRRRLLRFPQGGETLKKRWAPPLEKALTVLDDQLLPATSHAVERGKRRYRTRQKQVDRVRTHAQRSARVALDMWRAAQAAGRHQTLHTLHEARAA